MKIEKGYIYQKLKNYEEQQEQELDPMFGRPPHTFADSMMTSMGLMLVMGAELMLCIMGDLLFLFGLIMIV